MEKHWHCEAADGAPHNQFMQQDGEWVCAACWFRSVRSRMVLCTPETCMEVR